jgi:hypothetical protein
MRLIGPNCLGLVNFHTGLTLTATPALNTEVLLPGNLMVLSQSGSIMGALVSRGFARGIGFSKAISVGNEADLTVGDIGEAFVDDPDTSAFLMFLETLRDADALARFARRAFERNKPIVAYKLDVRSGAKWRSPIRARWSAPIARGRVSAPWHRSRNHLETVGCCRWIGRRPPQSDKPAVGVVTTTGGGAALVVDRLGLLARKRARAAVALRQLAALGRVNPGRAIDLTMERGNDAMKAALDALRDSPDSIILAVVGNSANSIRSGCGPLPMRAARGAGGRVPDQRRYRIARGRRQRARVPHAGIRASAIRAYLTWRADRACRGGVAPLDAARPAAIQVAFTLVANAVRRTPSSKRPEQSAFDRGGARAYSRTRRRRASSTRSPPKVFATMLPRDRNPAARLWTHRGLRREWEGGSAAHGPSRPSHGAVQNHARTDGATLKGQQWITPAWPEQLPVGCGAIRNGPRRAGDALRPAEFTKPGREGYDDKAPAASHSSSTDRVAAASPKHDPALVKEAGAATRLLWTSPAGAHRRAVKPRGAVAAVSAARDSSMGREIDPLSVKAQGGEAGGRRGQSNCCPLRRRQHRRRMAKARQNAPSLEK